MTATAIQISDKMGWIGLGVLTGRGHAMTRVAVCTGRHRTMIERRRFKGGSIMANTTILIGRYMAIDFTPREETVMAELTIIYDPNVRKGSRDETGGQVTHAAIIIGRYVGTVFAFGDYPVVTRGTTTDNAGVIILGTSKGRGVVTY